MLLVQKQETAGVGIFDTRPMSRRMWYRCSGDDPDRRYRKMVLLGWFISIDEQGFTTHSIRAREEPGPDGTVRKVLYDAMHNTCFGMDKEWLLELASGFSRAVVLSEEEFPLVQEITATGEAVLSPDFVEQYGEFLEQMKKAGPDIWRMPGWKPLYKREALAGYRGLPVAVAAKIREAHIPNVYINGGDIAFTKEAEPQVEALLREHFFRDMTEYD